MKPYFSFFLLWWPWLTLAQETNFTPETAASYLKLEPPISVEMAGVYVDGGSIAITLVDSRTNKVYMFEDHSLGTKTGGRIYLGDQKPTRSGRLTEVSEGRLIRQAVICLALAWYEKEFPSDNIPKTVRQEGESDSDYFRRYMRNTAASFILTKYRKKGI